MTRKKAPRLPWLVVALALLGVATFAIPIVALLVRTPWSRLGELLTDQVVVDALRISLLTSLGSTLIALTLGVPLAFLLSRGAFRGKTLVRALVTLPLILPPVVGGAALLFALGRRGVIGGPLFDVTGLVLPFSTWGVVVATTFVAMPFMVLTVEGGLQSLDTRYEGAASTLGAGRWTVLRRVTLPMLRPSLVAGAVLTWARAFGEFGATLTFAGSLQGRTETLPLAVFIGLESDRDIAIAISLLMIVVALAVLVSMRERWWGSP